MPVRIYGESYTHKFCAVVIDIFWNITCRQAISPVAKFHHVLGRGFMIQREVLIFIKCLSANRNRLFYMKVKYMKIYAYGFFSFNRESEYVGYVLRLGEIWSKRNRYTCYLLFYLDLHSDFKFFSLFHI